MKAHNPIDDMFQQHFAETAVPMNNQEEVWTRISGKKDDKRRGFFWLGSLGLVFCVVAGFGLINLNNNTGQDLVNNKVANSVVGNTSPNNVETSKVIVAEENSQEEKTVLKTEQKVLENNVQSENALREMYVEEKRIVSNVVNDNLNNSVSPLLNSSTISNVSSNVLDGTITELESKELVTNSRVASNLEFADLDKDQITLSTNIPPVVNQSDSWSKCEVKTPGHFFADIYGQAGLPMDKIELSQAGSDQTTYRDLWDTRFDPKASWHGGAQVGYEFRNGLRVSAGAEYQELVTEYSDNQQITETIRVYDPQAFFTVDMNGDRVWVGDTVTAINIYERKFVRKNTHTLLHIPLQLSYDIYKKPGFHVAVDVAAALNVSKTYEGQYIRSDQTLIMIDENNQDNYISKDIGVSFSAGLHLGKYLNDNWEVYASPRFRYNPNSFLLDTETLKVTRNMIGLRAGVRYHF